MAPPSTACSFTVAGGRTVLPYGRMFFRGNVATCARPGQLRWPTAPDQASLAHYRSAGVPPACTANDNLACAHTATNTVRAELASARSDEDTASGRLTTAGGDELPPYDALTNSFNSLLPRLDPRCLDLLRGWEDWSANYERDMFSYFIRG